MHTSGAVLVVKRGVNLWICARGAKRCIFLVLYKGCNKVYNSRVVLGLQLGAYFWCCVRGAKSHILLELY